MGARAFRRALVLPNRFWIRAWTGSSPMDKNQWIIEG
jgi:hypothetical protein